MIWGVLFIVVGLGAIGAAFGYWRRVESWLSRAETTTAEIVRLESSLPGQRKPENPNVRVTVFPVVRFTDAGGTQHEVRSRMGMGYGRLKDRRTIEVTFDPNSPDDVRLGRGADRGFAIALGLFGLAATVIGVAGMW